MSLAKLRHALQRMKHIHDFFLVFIWLKFEAKRSYRKKDGKFSYASAW